MMGNARTAVDLHSTNLIRERLPVQAGGQVIQLTGD
jgi:hypothetical protein